MPPEVAAGVFEQPGVDVGPTGHAELDAREVQRLAVRGFGALLVRTLGQRGLMMVGNILLARWLAPEMLGLYAIVSFVVGIAGFLSDMGMGASLVQRRESLDPDDLRTAFTLSAILDAGVFAIVVGAAPLIVRAYHFGPGHVAPVRVLALSILIGAFSVVPATRMERRLEFNRLSFAELAAQATYVAVALPLAFARRDVWCFVWGTLASQTVNTVLVNVASPWRPRFGIVRDRLRAMLRFGLPYQLNGFVNMAKDNFIPTFVAVVTNARSVGFLIWAVGLATNALFLMPIVSRVTFPAYARLQQDPVALRVAIEKSIRWVAATVFPTTLLLAALARQIVEHVYGPKWAPGLPSFYLLCIPMLNAAYSTVMVSALYALGRARVVLRLTTIWALAGWALGVPFTLWLGAPGFAAAMSLVSWLSVLTVREMNKVVRVEFVRPLLRIFAISAAPAAAVAAIARFVVHDVLSLAVLGFAGAAAYLVLAFAAGELVEVRRLLARRFKAAVEHA